MPMYENRKRRFGDRKDGFRLRRVTPLFRLTPFIMKERADSLVYYEFDCDITKAERILRELRQSDYHALSYTHLSMAAIARTMAEYPKMNRFVAGRRVYARKKMKFSLAAKTSISDQGKEYLLVTEVDPRDTLIQVAEKFDAQLATVLKENVTENGTDKLLNFFGHFPRFLLSFTVWAVRALDFLGIMPMALANALPFFSSAFVTNIGSIGGDSIYHHVYNFGTVSVFLAFGGKKNVREIRADGSVDARQKITFRICADERICDGYDYICAMRAFKFYFEHPNALMKAGEKVLEDPDL